MYLVKILQNSQENTCHVVLGWRSCSPRLATLLNKGLHIRCFNVNFCKISQNSYSVKHLLTAVQSVTLGGNHNSQTMYLSSLSREFSKNFCMRYSFNSFLFHWTLFIDLFFSSIESCLWDATLGLCINAVLSNTEAATGGVP